LRQLAGNDPRAAVATVAESRLASSRAILTLDQRTQELERFRTSKDRAKGLLEAAPTAHEGPIKKKAAYITSEAAHQFTLLTGDIVRRNPRPKDGMKRESEFVKFLSELFARMGIDASAEYMTKDFLAKRKTERLAEWSPN